METPKRKPVSTRTRFEIFKRDGFKCLYCGKSPPATILHVDHVLPVVEGGSNEPANLVTACQDCNLGKSDVLLSQKPASLKHTERVERERFAQLKAYNAWLSEKRQQQNHWLRQISDFWVALDGEDPRRCRIGRDRELMVTRFLSFLPSEEIIDALSVTYGKTWIRKDFDRTRYFAGVCWKKIKERSAP
jgi:hypothetical protein